MARGHDPQSAKMVLPALRLPDRSLQASPGVFLAHLGWISKGAVSFLQAFAITLTALGLGLFTILILLEPLPQKIGEVQQRKPPHVYSSFASSWTFDAWRSPPLEDRLMEQPPGPGPFPLPHPMARFVPPPPLKASPRHGSMVTYLDRIQGKINSLWRPPPLSAPGQLSVVVAIGVRASGQLTRVTVVHPSGDKAFDESALRAIRQALPFPPLPMDLEDPLEVELRFHATWQGHPLTIQAIQEERVLEGNSPETRKGEIETERIEERLKVAPENPQPS